MADNPFEDVPPRRSAANPFGDEDDRDSGDPGEAAATVAHAAARIRRLKQQIGAEGLSLSATRELIDQLTRALDATAAALEALEREPDG